MCGEMLSVVDDAPVVKLQKPLAAESPSKI
jgi:hypothetical protein